VTQPTRDCDRAGTISRAFFERSVHFAVLLRLVRGVQNERAIDMPTRAESGRFRSFSNRRTYTMRAGTGLSGLARGIARAIVVMLCAGVTPAQAADPPADAKAAPDAVTSAPPASLETSAATGAEAAAQAPTPPTDPTDPNPGALALAGSFDGVSTYMFRGIRQNATGIALWPVVDLGIAIYSGDGSLKSVGANVGTWNSLHTGDTGQDGPTGKLGYESDFYSTLGLGFGHGVSVATTYTAYTSPNNAFTTVKEIAFKVGLDDSAALGKASLKPYGLVAFEFDTDPGRGQADGGAKAGRYLELGVSPGYAWPKASVTVPVKVGLSLADYYELNTGTAAAPSFDDNTFGYFSVAGLVTVPLGGTTRFGSWNLHGGVEVQALGDTTKAFNGGDSSRVIGSIGVGFSY
jgi:hypothetical protein